MKTAADQLVMFDIAPEGTTPTELTRGCLLPAQQPSFVDVKRAGLILGISKPTVIEYLNEGLLTGYRIADSQPWGIYYESIVALCDQMRLKFCIRDRRPKLADNMRRWKDRELLPFPLDDTIFVRDAAVAFDTTEASIQLLISDRAPNEPGVFDAYRFRDRRAPWRISRSSLIKYAENRKRICS